MIPPPGPACAAGGAGWIFPASSEAEMRTWPVLAALLAAGCAGRVAESPLRPGDVVRPQVAFAPKAPWHQGTKVALGMLIQIHRPGRMEAAFLGDSDVRPEQAVLRCRVTFLDGDEPLDEPLEVPFVHDC
jgi:hypothetical protein